MPEVFRAFGQVFVVFPNDHPPPHVHVLGPGWEIKLTLTRPPDVAIAKGRVTRSEARRALSLFDERFADLLTAWRELHE